MKAKRATHRWVVFVVVTGLGALPFHSRAAEPGSEGTTKIEYVEVEGGSCLRPLVGVEAVELNDYRDAGQRWLSQRYPGSRTRTWQTMLVLPAVADLDADLDAENDAPPEIVEYRKETVQVELADGSMVAGCFDINLTSRKKSLDE